ncbi:MAG: CocE/NonD family hydrolase [Terrimicrobiaceae bacterium]
MLLCLFAGILTLSAEGQETLSGKPLPDWFKYYASEHQVVIEHDFLQMPDGVRLAVTYFKPADASTSNRYPIVVAMLPYRKDDEFYAVDYGIFTYLAERGIAGARIDVRGTGGSEGNLVDREYSDRELDDLEFSIGKLAQIPWCSGKIGLQGKSWAGFNALMMAMRQPPALKALLVAHASQDLYGNDVHCIDGVLHLDIFNQEMETDNLIPKSPDYSLDPAYFTERFDREPWILTYLRNQRDGRFWQDGRSLSTAYDRVKIPIYAIGGLLDGYRDYVPAILDHVTAPVKAEIGPWNHAWPNDGSPGPNYNNWQTAVRWWKQWLCDEDTGILREPKLTVFVRDTVPARDDYAVTPGKFEGFDWPIPDKSSETFHLTAAGTLTAEAGKSETLTIPCDPDAGIDAGSWWGERTPDMRKVAAGEQIFDSAPLGYPSVMLGQAAVHLKAAAEAPLANWAVRLEDLHPDGSVTLVTGGGINGSQRKSRTEPTELTPGEFVDLNFPLHFTSYTFAAGHRIRVVISNAQFPMFWPTPFHKPTQLAVGDGASTIQLPFLKIPGASADFLLQPVKLSVPADFELLAGSLGDAPPPSEIREGDWTKVQQTEQQIWKIGPTRFQDRESVTYRVNRNDPAQAGFLGEGMVILTKGDREVEVKTRVDVRSDAKNFDVTVSRIVSENGAVKGEKEWRKTIPRDFQ